MRLIDADKLELKHFVQRVTEQPISYEGTQPIYANYDIIAYDVDNAPTVKAIPIEWLHSIMEKQFIFAMNSDGVIHYISGAIGRQVLANVIEIWEKENEESSNSD